MSAATEDLLACPFCDSKAELNEWEEIDAKRWAAQIKCTHCGAEGPTGYANNHVGCYDAVNDLHKERAIAGWNARGNKTEPENLDQSDAILTVIDRIAEAGLCSMTHSGTRAFLKDIRALIEKNRSTQ